MFAGPNGSGKSTLKEELLPEWLGVYVNADEIEKALQSPPCSLDLRDFKVQTSQAELSEFFAASPLLKREGLKDAAQSVRLHGGAVSFGSLAVNSYHAAVLADFIRQKLVANQVSFSFETVMSGPDKIVQRYGRSLDNLRAAIRCSSRAYIFDNSGEELVLLAEVTDGNDVELKVNEVPEWFIAAVLTEPS